MIDFSARSPDISGRKAGPSTLRRALVALGVLLMAGQGDAAAQDGQQLFATRCAACHGTDASGGFGPDLTAPGVTGRDAEALFRIIRSGVPGTAMPPSTAPDAEVRALVRYIHSFAAPPARPAARASADGWSSLQGSAERGEVIFLATCARCHTAGASASGTTGPVLTGIAGEQTRAYLVNAIRNPDESIRREYLSATLVTREGQVRGVILQEDDITIRLRTLDGRERTFQKEDLLDLVHDEGSMMPSFSTNRLSDGELNDVLVYLRSLATAR